MKGRESTSAKYIGPVPPPLPARHGTRQPRVRDPHAPDPVVIDIQD